MQLNQQIRKCLIPIELIYNRPGIFSLLFMAVLFILAAHLNTSNSIAASEVEVFQFANVEAALTDNSGESSGSQAGPIMNIDAAQRFNYIVQNSFRKAQFYKFVTPFWLLSLILFYLTVRAVKIYPEFYKILSFPEVFLCAVPVRAGPRQ